MFTNRSSPLQKPDLNQVTPVKFTEPQCVFESSAEYTNTDTDPPQKFRILVRGLKVEYIQAYIQELKVYLEAVPISPEEVSDLLQKAEDLKPSGSEEPGDFSEGETPVEIEFIPIDLGDIEPPYTVRFAIDPNSVEIYESGQGRHVYKYQGTYIEVQLMCLGGRNKTWLTRNGARVAGLFEIDVDPGTPAPQTSPDMLDGSGAPVEFRLVVSGKGSYAAAGCYLP